MPVSRRRIKRNRSDLERRRAAKRDRESRRLAATATDAQLSALLSDAEWATRRTAADAELQGDAEKALDLYATIDRFEGSIHRRRLELLVELGDEAPPWLISRWLTLQARRPLWTGAPQDAGDPPAARALQIAYPHGLSVERMRRMSPATFAASLYELDWVLRHLMVYEDGGLADLVHRFASPALLSRADSPEAWASAVMVGYRLESDGGPVQVTDLGTGATLDLLDLGVGCENLPGQHLLGRVVPTSWQPGRMFEWRPLPVDEGTARDVASSPEVWLDIVADHALTGQLPLDFSLMEHGTDVLTDVRELSWSAALWPEDLDRLPVVDGWIDGDDIALVVLEGLLGRFGFLGRVPAPMQPMVFSLVLQPGLSDAIEGRLCGPEQSAGWWVMASSLRQPAAGRARGYAERCRRVG
jgi:hypothetical protein